MWAAYYFLFQLFTWNMISLRLHLAEPYILVESEQLRVANWLSRSMQIGVTHVN